MSDDQKTPADAAQPAHSVLDRLSDVDKEKVRRELVTGEPSGIEFSDSEKLELLREALDEGLASGVAEEGHEIFERIRRELQGTKERGE